MARNSFPADDRGLIREALRMDGLSVAECRSIFLDWALGLPAGQDAAAAAAAVLAHYAPPPDHPMTRLLEEATAAPPTPRRRGRRGGRGRKLD